MYCLKCKNKKITKLHHDRKILDGDVKELYRDCNQCGDVFIIYKDSTGKLTVKYRDR